MIASTFSSAAPSPTCISIWVSGSAGSSRRFAGAFFAMNHFLKQLLPSSKPFPSYPPIYTVGNRNVSFPGTTVENIGEAFIATPSILTDIFALPSP